MLLSVVTDDVALLTSDKTRMMWLSGDEKNFDHIFSHSGTMHARQRDGWMDHKQT